jgi:hypothetical protein
LSRLGGGLRRETERMTFTRRQILRRSAGCGALAVFATSRSGQGAAAAIAARAAAERSAAAATLPSRLPEPRPGYVAAGSLASPHATQAAAADGRFVYAVSSTRVVRYDRSTGGEAGESVGPAKHLNSAFPWDGKVYCAHSNYPAKPEQGDVRVLDPATMTLSVFHALAEPPGSLTWAVRKGDDWWCHFAGYGAENGRSVLVRFDAKWRETGRWTYPPALVADWGKYSLSGGVWQGDDLLATGHDKRVVYKLRVPPAGGVVEVADVVTCPFPGQGIAVDPTTGGLVGIDRAKKQIVFARPGSPASSTQP